MLRVRLLGELGVESDGDVRTPAGRPARELLAWLALHPGAHPRLELASRFWPDVLESSARASLRTALHELRRELGEVVVADRETVALAQAWVDALAVRSLPAEEALALCTGEALPGLDRDWAIAFRDEHREYVAALLAGLAESASGDVALRWAREHVRTDPLSEEATRRLMRLLAQAGDRAAALTAYARLAERLRRELRVVPSRRTRELAEELRAGEDGDAPASAFTAPGLAGRDGALPRALAPRGPFAGRDAELARVVARLGDGLVVLAGEPGIGKTRLLAEVARAAELPVRYGACYEDSLVPYQPFVEALGEVMPEADGEGGRWRLFETIGTRLAGQLLILDDLHWADAGTLRLLEHLLRRPEPPAVVAAYRDSEVTRTHPLAATLADLTRAGLIERIAVRGLDEDAVRALVPDDAERIAAHTAGNPFFIEQLVRHRADGGDPHAIPEGVKDVIGRRLTRLSPATQSVLAIAAVAGREHDVATLEALLPDADVLAALEEAAAAHMVREAEPGRYAFTHALVQETLYDELSLTRRVRTHRALADALPADRLSELAHHRLQAGDVDEAAVAALAAARRAMRAFAYEDAATLCERALEAKPGDPELLLQLGDACLRAGDKPRARKAFRQVDGDAAQQARAALGFSGLGATIIAVDRDAVDVLEQALEALPGDHPLRPKLLARLAIETYYEATPAQRKALVDQAAAGDPETLNARHAALWSPQHLQERLALADRMIAEAPDAEAELQGRNWRVLDLMELGEIDAARTEIEAHERLAETLKLPAYEWWAPMWRSSLAILEGRSGDARELIARVAAVDDPNAKLYADINTFVAALIARDPNPLDAAIVERETGRPAEYAYRAGYAWVLALEGRPHKAREQIEYATTHIKEDMNLLAALTELAQALHILGDAHHARQVYDALAPYADRNIVNGRGGAGYGSAELHLGLLAELLGKPDAARGHHARARANNLRMNARAWL